MNQLDLNADSKEDLNQQIAELNEKLRAAGASSAELALGLVIRLGFLPMLGVVLLLMLFKVINIILGFVVFIIISLVLLGISMLISERARLNAMKQLYILSIENEIDQFLHDYGMTRQQFDIVVTGLLPANAPLNHFLSPDAGEVLQPTHDGEMQEEG